MLTGDKQETAVNIGFSCRLIDHSQELFKLDCDSLENTATLLREYKQNAEGFVKQGKSLALIITDHPIPSPSPFCLREPRPI